MASERSRLLRFLRSVSMRRWGDPFAHHTGEYRFEVTFAGEYHADGMVIPDQWTAAWVDSTGHRQEFFRASIDTAEFLLSGGRS